VARLRKIVATGLRRHLEEFVCRIHLGGMADDPNESSGHGSQNTGLPRVNVKNIRYHLAVAGIVETTVFPDLEGLGRELTAQYAKPIKERP
jgi:hypothetical protein